MMSKFFRPRESIIVVIQIISLLAFMWGLIFTREWSWWILSLFGYFLITCLGITVTFHRLLAHRSYKLWKPLEFLFSLFGNLGCTGSSMGWVCIHRKHHRFTDVEGDPHGPTVHGRLGAVMGDYDLVNADFYTIKDMIESPMHKALHFTYFFYIFGLMIILGAISSKLLIHAYLIPVFFNVFISRMSNWIDHEVKFGKVVYNINDDSRNVWWWALMSFGEGWHNNHHADSRNYRIGKKILEIDFGRYVIACLIWMGLATEERQTIAN